MYIVCIGHPPVYMMHLDSYVVNENTLNPPPKLKFPLQERTSIAPRQNMSAKFLINIDGAPCNCTFFAALENIGEFHVL